jgi:hypothetical protein
MAFPSAGTNTPNRITFNSGTIDFGAMRIVQVDNITVSFEATTNPQYVIGSIKPQALVRHSLKFSLTAKVKSIPAEIEALAWGASSGGVTPVEDYVLDGQPTFQNPVVTLFDLNNKQYCYQLLNAIWKSDKGNMKMADYSEWDFELEAMDMTLLYTT